MTLSRADGVRDVARGLRSGEPGRARSPETIARLLYGTDEPAPRSIELRAGPLDLTYRAGKLLHIRLGDVEVWHGVTFPFRDPSTLR